MDVLDHVVIATDSSRIAEVCRGLGAPVELTSPDHPSGTDRVAEVAERPAFRAYEHIVNIQGDEPLIDPEHVRRTVALVVDGGWDVGTCAAPIETEEAYHDHSVVKVARAEGGAALYFSRAPIPHARDGAVGGRALGAAPFLRHVGIYGYTRDALARWVSMAPSPLERTERLEQLRALEGGLRIGVALVVAAASGIDTPDDVVRLEAQLRSEGSTTFA